MKTQRLALLAALLATPALAAEPKTEEQKTLYAVGLAVARELAVFQLTPADLELVKQGIADGVTGKKPAVSLDEYNAKVQELAKTRTAAASKDFLEKAAQEKGAVRTESGLVYLSLKDGTGDSPGPKDTVKVNYRGTLPGGKEFDSSYKRGEPIEFPLSGVIKCWTEGVAKMKVGGKARLVCPSSIAYGERGAGSTIPPNATLVFEVELLEVKKAP
jgi:FKBP-type peptidyl-prolyl cis-trans isomerase FkpA